MYEKYILSAVSATPTPSIAPRDAPGAGTSADDASMHRVPLLADRVVTGPPLAAGARADAIRSTVAGTPAGKPPRTTRETVLQCHRWAPTLLSIRVTRDPGFRFAPGQYARIGVADAADQPVFRPVSIASPPADPALEFLCTLIPGGEFSGRLAGLRAGDPVEIERPSYGFLTVDTLAPGSDLWLLATGTGLAPFLSMLRDRAVWRTFDRLVVVHSVRRTAELAHADELRRLASEPPQPRSSARLRYLPVVTREPGASGLTGRIPALIASGRLAGVAEVPLEPSRSRVMVCGNPDMTRELRALLRDRGFHTSRRGAPGQVAFEKYW